MKGKYNFRIRPPARMRSQLAADASRKLVTYRTYVKAILTKAAEKQITFAPTDDEQPEVIETRVYLDKTLKPVVQKLAKDSNRSPEEWALEVLKIHDQILDK